MIFEVPSKMLAIVLLLIFPSIKLLALQEIFNSDTSTVASILLLCSFVFTFHTIHSYIYIYIVLLLNKNESLKILMLIVYVEPLFFLHEKGK